MMFTAPEFDGTMLDSFDAAAFGCPSMGMEELEESEFVPMFLSCKEKLNGRKIALFGSYGWGDGEWMRGWAESCRRNGAVLVHEPVICNDAPDGAAAASCKSLGAALTQKLKEDLS